MRFRVLGAVDAVSDDQPLDLGHARLRSVLAVLLVDANRFVSVDQLMQRVWGDRPPQRGRDVLYSYLSRLRAALSADPAVAIERRSGGYLLGVDEASVDLYRFRALVDEARLASGDARALALFDEALRLWRGTPFADLDTPWLASVRAALEVERRAAELDRTDVALRCGRHAELLADLSRRAEQQPFDERVAGQLMLAMAGTGRQTEALTVYQHTREVLLDQLGLEPGPELRRLHQHILTGAAPAPTDAAAADIVVPRQLPAAARHFTGRQAELDTLTGLLDPTGTVVISAINGMAGVGKTALAVHAAHRLADRFPDGVLFTDLRGFTPDAEPTPPERVLDHLLRGLGVPGPRIPPDLEGRTGLYRSVLARRRVLIVLDNAAHEAQLQPLLPAAAGCLVIVTSRRHLAGLDDATHLTLPVLDPERAAELFRGLAGDRVTAADQPTIDRIVALCGRLPLAIRIAAARLRLAPPATLCAELAEALDHGRGLDWLSDGHRAIGAALAVSYRHLGAQQQSVFRLAGLHPGPSIEPYAMAAMADTTVEDARRLLRDLHDASLVDQPAPGRYTLHDLVAVYATTLDLPESDRRGALDRLYDHYAARAVDLTSQRAAVEPAWLEAETDNLLAAARHAAVNDRGDHTARQSAALRRHLRTHGRFSQAAVLHQDALCIARATSDRDGEQDALNGLGNVHRLQGRYELAADCLTQALDVARRIGNRNGEQEALNGLGTVHYAQGRYEPATDCYARALDIARQTGNRHGEEEALRGLGYLHYMRGRYGPAADCLERALEIARRIGNDQGEQVALRGLGTVHYLQGRYEQAAECYEQALADDRRAGNRHGEQDALNGLGNVHHLLGRHGQAADCHEQALRIARQTGNRHGELYALRGLGNVHHAQRRFESAADCYRLTLAGAEETGNRNGQFEAHHGLGRVHHATGEDHDARRHHQLALDLAIDLDQPADQARAHGGLADTHLALGNPGQARDHWQAALDLLAGIGTDHTEEPGVTAAAIRDRLAELP